MDADGLSAFLQRLESHEAADICQREGISDAEIGQLRAALHHPEQVLFYSWIMQNQALEAMLMRGELSRFEDRGNFLSHQLAGAYRRFVSPWLAARLLKFAGADRSALEKAFSFIPLLDNDHSPAVEQQLFRGIRDEVENTLVRAKKVQSEDELVALIQPLCEDRVLACVNFLSRPMYATRLKYVDDMLSVIRMKSCTVRFANWILKQMERVSLNREHAYKLDDLRKELKEGKLTVRNPMRNDQTSIPWARMISLAVLGLAIAFVVYVIAYKPFSDVEVVVAGDDTSFEQFSPEERKRIDSMLQEMSSQRSDDAVLDPNAPILGGGASIVLRKSFQNLTLERIYDDFSKDADLQDAGYRDTCLRAVQFQPIQGTQDLKKHKGALAAMFRNDSAYDVLVLVAENTGSGAVYSALLKSGDIEVLQMDKGDILWVIAGNTFQQYHEPAGALPDELPSPLFKHHFCDTDFNYSETIRTPYEVKSIDKGKTKFLINGDLGTYVDLVDLYDVLEPW